MDGIEQFDYGYVDRRIRAKYGDDVVRGLHEKLQREAPGYFTDGTVDVDVFGRALRDVLRARPVGPLSAEPGVLPDEALAAGGAPMQVCVIDDDPDNREALAATLPFVTPADIEVEVSEASDGEEGLCLIEQVKPVLVFSDLNMPNIDGLDLMSKLPADPGRMVVLCTGWQWQERDRTRLGEVTLSIPPQLDAILAKPFTVPDVANVVAVAHANQRRELELSARLAALRRDPDAVMEGLDPDILKRMRAVARLTKRCLTAWGVFGSA